MEFIQLFMHTWAWHFYMKHVHFAARLSLVEGSSFLQPI
jgi:hypothetical protein